MTPGDTAEHLCDAFMRARNARLLTAAATRKPPSPSPSHSLPSTKTTSASTSLKARRECRLWAYGDGDPEFRRPVDCLVLDNAIRLHLLDRPMQAVAPDRKKRNRAPAERRNPRGPGSGLSPVS
jgi:hypothetical protein